jgi:intracellular septation protein
MSQLTKTLIEVGPLIAFFAGYFVLDDLIFATAIFMAVTLIAIGFALVREGRVSPMLWISALIVLFFGGLTVALGDETFIKMKPTIVYVIFAVILMSGLAFGKTWLKHLFGTSFQINDQGWRILTLRWSAFFVVMAGVNEFVWRSYSTDVWISFKFPVAIIITFLFAIAQTRLIMRHQVDEEDGTGDPSPGD